MANIINIETSTEVCSVALSQDNKILWHKENFDGQSHSVLLAKYLEEMQSFINDSKTSIDAVAVSCGPGSYTGLRIGVSTAKGLCYGLGKPLIAVPTLQLLANSVVKNNNIPDGALLCPMVDARRMEVYTAFFDKNLIQIGDTRAEIISEDTYKEKKEVVFYFGNGAKKCNNVFDRDNFQFIDNVSPLAYDMPSISEKLFLEKKFEDVAYFEPFYLKEFVATIAKNKVLTK